ncbi:flagellar biosynthesis protein FlhF [Variovorax saccharolyticus]|uniref:flagellar biosynthesis protein FlhF n=1 Tax=Variovorax saccharolyticus TaxID=3053516 RepID=UPI002575B9BE|nr:flagellar biosynthesis protein FlhF [Variovorax sp. J22R187]MDM0021278.1 flagellar biosynthesis protein FlhF [Variovorax sp. J22R187]
MNIATDVRTTARKFVAATSREALRLVREALGAEAIVLNHRATPEGVEIVAMAEGEVSQAVAVASAAPLVAARAPVPAPEPAPAPAPQPMPVAAPPRIQAPLPAAAAPVAAAAAVVAPTPAAPADLVMNELHSMRGMLEEQLASVVWNDRQRQDPVRGRLLRTLLGAGFSAKLSKAMLEKLPTGQSYAEGMAFARAELIRAVPVHEDEDALLAQGGVYALMGPTGVGKTTTTAKLAARCVMRFGADKLALVTTDSYRIGAYEQLRIYGQILDVPVFAVKDAADLHLVLQDLRDKHMVLIDTVGMSQRDRSVSDQIAMLCNSHRPVKRLLLLNATSHGDTLNEVVHAYRHGGGGNDLAGCIFTKVDEATHPGALIDTVIRHRLPVHYISSGQKVPENLMLADRAQLVDSVFQPRRHNALFVPAEVDLQDEPAGAAPSAQVVQAQAEAERLRMQYQNLIRAMAHDAQELATAAGALAGAQIGFEGARRLWRHAGEEAVGQKAVLEDLMLQARSEVSGGCDAYVLALSGQVGLRSNEGGDAYECQGSLLLSDRTGLPLAAPNQWLSTAAVPGGQEARRKPGLRQVQWLRQQALGRKLVHVLPRLPTLEAMIEWQAQGQRWLARAPGSTPVIDPVTGATGKLARLGLAFSVPRALTFRGKPALQCEAEAEVRLRISPSAAVDPAALPVLRCVVTRVLDARGQKILSQSYLLSNLGGEASALQLAQWQGWAAEAEPCFRLLRQGVQLVGGMGELGDPDMMKRLLVAGQVSTTVWRLLQAKGDWADRTRMLMNQLSGRPVRSSRPLTGNALYVGVAKLFMLLEALGTESTAPTQQPRVLEQQG